MTEHITGQQARELLAGTTPGPWTATEDHIMRSGWEQRERERTPWDDDDPYPWSADESEHVLMNPEPEWRSLTKNRPDMVLSAAAPALAETVAWLYGRESEATECGDVQCVDGGAGLVVEYKPGMVRPGRSFGADLGDLTPDEAVEFARALLAAAEVARRQAD